MVIIKNNSGFLGRITPSEFSRLLHTGGYVALDVRTEEEHKTCDLSKNTMCVDFYNEKFTQHIEALDKTQKYLLYCRSGNRSSQTIPLMHTLGFTFYEMEGGIIQWTADGLDIVGDTIV